MDTNPTNDSRRMRREKRTIAAMIRIYCRSRHGTRCELCPDCRELLEYALERLARCPFGGEKTTCARCPIHCYRPEMRAQARAVMRYAGPRMILFHPILALMHYVDNLCDWRRGEE